MNPHEPSLGQAPASPVVVAHRRRWFIAIAAGLVVLAAAGSLGVMYFTQCGNCDRGPILCDNPCTLPTFG
jgi:hypothetical protein